MGRHSGEARDQGGFAPGRPPGPETPPRPESPPRPPWTARRKVLTGLGGLTAAIVIAGGASAAAGAFSGAKPMTKLSRQAATAPAGSASPVGVGSAAVAGASARGASPKPSAHPRVRLGTNLTSLPINAALTGSPAVAWADAALAALGAPATSANVQTMQDWFANEGTPHNPNNPLNLQTPWVYSGGGYDSIPAAYNQ